jgi:hypothetical protein
MKSSSLRVGDLVISKFSNVSKYHGFGIVLDAWCSELIDLQSGEINRARIHWSRSGDTFNVFTSTLMCLEEITSLSI